MLRLRIPGPSRSRLLAGYLAGVGGFVNSAGFVLLGSFTSHVTGNVGRFAGDVVASDFAAATAALVMVLAFFAGAFSASLGIESRRFGRQESAVVALLLVEAALLLVFIGASRSHFFAVRARGMDLNAALLCAAMGIQNSLITRLSGAVVRTTHLTGVVTDLGIEAAHWFRWWRSDRSSALAEPPSAHRIALLGTIAGAFMFGAIAGTVAVAHLRHDVMAIPALGLGLAALRMSRVGLPAR